MVLLERLVKGDWTQASWGANDPPFAGRKEPEQSQINPKKRKPRMFSKMMVQKDWAAFDAMRNSPEAQKAAITKNHEVAQSLLAQFHSLKNDPKKTVKLNDCMLTQGYIPDSTDKGETIYLPLTGNTGEGKISSNPVAGHKVHIVLNHKTGHVDAVSRYT